VAPGGPTAPSAGGSAAAGAGAGGGGPRYAGSSNGSRGGDGARSGASTAMATAVRPASSPAGIRQLGELLLSEGVVTGDDLQSALLSQSKSGRRLGAELVALGAIDDLQLARALAGQTGLPLADLSQETPSAEAIKLLPEHAARESLAIALRVENGIVTIAVADPQPEVQHRVTQAVGRNVAFAVAPAKDIRRAIDGAYRALSEVGRYVAAFQSEVADRATDSPDEAQLSKAGSDAPVVRIVDMILTQALRDRASDVHIEPQGDSVRVRYRIDGALHEVLNLPGKIAPAVVSRIKIMAGMNIVERRRPQDGQIVTVIDGRELDLRVSTLSTIFGEKCVLRLLDKSKQLYRMSDLGMPAETNELLSKMIHSPFGMVLCAGPTGSGKTTTLYASLQELNDPRRNIMTIEDPVEYVFPSINQIQTNDQTGLTFAQGLKSILRQDPDVILVGEIRDVDTARIAVQSALTGHFVLSSLHATDAVAALHRFLDMGIESFLIASSVVCIIGQRLVRRTCTSCKVPYTPTADELSFYKDAGGKDKRQFSKGEGCNFCAETGYQDRIGVFEVLRITPEIRRLVVGWATQEELERVAVAQGMRTLQQEAIRLVEDDVTTIDEVVRSIYAA
jgi:type IV pilus assembly protein PilB